MVPWSSTRKTGTRRRRRTSRTREPLAPATACRAPGGELHPDLRVEGPVVRKGTEGEDGYSGLSVRDPETGEEDATALDGMLRERDIRRVVVAGLAQDVCVHETARDAVDKGYDTTVLLAATRPVAPDEADKLVAELRDIGVTIASVPTDGASGRSTGRSRRVRRMIRPTFRVERME